MIRAVLFDLDGTLVNSLHDIAASMNRTLAEHGLPTWAEDDYRLLVGDGARVLAQRAVRDRADLAEAVLRDYQPRYRAHSLDSTDPYPGIPELLRALRERGLRLCVFSNKPHVDTLHVVARCFPDSPFTLVQGQVEEVPVKPDPTGALRLAERLAIAPADFAYLGDTATDIACAVNAGMCPVGVTWGFRDLAELRDAGARYIIDHPLDLLPILSDAAEKAEKEKL